MNRAVSPKTSCWGVLTAFGVEVGNHKCSCHHSNLLLLGVKDLIKHVEYAALMFNMILCVVVLYLP